MLEVRALLSATVHAAVAHAEHAVHAASHAATAIHFAGPMTAAIDVEELANFGFEIGGKISKASVGTTAGQAFSASFQIKASGSPFSSLSGKFAGTVNGVTSNPAGQTIFDIVPSGTIKATGILDGHRFTVKLSPKAGEDFSLKLNSDNTFASLLMKYVLPNSGKFHGGEVLLTLSG
jgi:hypothetical protein